MSKFISILFFILLSSCVLMQAAEAARFGGGRSFGMQRSVSSFSSRAAATPSRLAQPNTGNKWLGPLAGFALGGLLTSLFMGHGFGSGIFSWLMLIGFGLMIWNFMRNRLQTVTPNNVSNISQFTPLSNVTPAGFDSTSFLREAKVQFIRLQTAFDNKNLNDIREFTSPEVFAEIQLQIQERGDALNITEVISLDAELVDIDSASQNASVDFSGMIKETPEKPAEPFKELWHFQKDMTKNKWTVTGVQQY